MVQGGCWGKSRGKGKAGVPWGENNLSCSQKKGGDRVPGQKRLEKRKGTGFAGREKTIAVKQEKKFSEKDERLGWGGEKDASDENREKKKGGLLVS